MNSIKPSVSSSLFTFLGGNLSSPFTSMFLSWSQDCIIEKVLEFRYRSIRQWQAKKAGCCTSFSAFFFLLCACVLFNFRFPHRLPGHLDAHRFLPCSLAVLSAFHSSPPSSPSSSSHSRSIIFVRFSSEFCTEKWTRAFEVDSVSHNKKGPWSDLCVGVTQIHVRFRIRT